MSGRPLSALPISFYLEFALSYSRITLTFSQRSRPISQSTVLSLTWCLFMFSLFNFQGTTALVRGVFPPFLRALRYNSTVFRFCQALFLSFSKNFFEHFGPHFCLILSSHSKDCITEHIIVFSGIETYVLSESMLPAGGLTF